MQAGWSGNVIDQIQGLMKPSLQQNPSVIALHAGTNDMFAPTASARNLPYDEAPQRLGSPIDQIIDLVPSTTVILVAQIIHALDGDQDARAQTYNAAISGVVQARGILAAASKWLT